MKIFTKKIFLLASSMLFCFIILPPVTHAQHISFSCENGRTGDNGTQCNEDAIDRDNVSDKHGSRVVSITKFTVKYWQQCVRKLTSEADTIFGTCHKDCLDKIASPKYYDDPKTPGTQTSAQNIKLPVVLAWDPVRGFGDDSAQRDACIYGSSDDCHHLEEVQTLTGDGYGPLSYHIQIQDDSASGIANLTIPTIKNGQVETADNGKQAFYAILKKNSFNSLEDAGPCFFNSTDTYHWRVVACCNANGTGCKDWPRDWWTFTASTAPEPSVQPDKISLLMDPDWNGKSGATAESFKDIVPSKEPLRWCAAKLPAKYQVAGLPVQYAKSYKIEVTSSEQNSFTQELLKKITDWAAWLSGGSSSAGKQTTHSLSIINGGWMYEIKPVGGNIYSWYSPLNNRGDVETWYPSQGRQDLAYFSRDHIYSWKLQSCTDDNAIACFCDNGDSYRECPAGSSNEYGQEWKVKTPDEKIDSPDAISPKNDPEGKEPVGFPVSLSWTIPAGANSFRYKTTMPGLEEGKTSWSSIPNNEFSDDSRNLFTLEKSNLKLNTLYKWQVRSCAQFDPDATKKSGGLDCDEWSEEFSFVTTGRPPLQSSMEPSLSSTITFPQNFKWEKVPGAKSYNFKLFDGAAEIAAAAKTVKFGPSDSGQPGTQADYPDILPPVDIDGKTYTWKVQTCADENGKYCGEWQSQYFKSTRPKTPEPKTNNKTNGSLNDVDFSWTGQTKYYWVTINYEKGTVEQSDCDLKNPIVDKQIDKNSCSVSNGCIPSDIKGSCIGTYEWTVQPCVNPDCSDKGGDNRLANSFLIVKQTSESSDVLAVCGQAFNNTKTGWDETEKCEIRHIFLLIKIFIDFLLFKLSIWLLPILVLITGGFFYLGKEGPNTAKYVKDAWIRVGIGYAVLFMAWFLVSWIMAAAGFEGDWWKIL